MHVLAGGRRVWDRLLRPGCRQEYGYSRDRAAATLAMVAKEADIRAYLRPLALAPLKRMLLTQPGEERWWVGASKMVHDLHSVHVARVECAG